MDFLGSAAWEAGDDKDLSIHSGYLPVVFNGSTRNTRRLRLGRRNLFMDFLGSEVREAGDAKLSSNTFRVPFNSFLWPY